MKSILFKILNLFKKLFGKLGINRRIPGAEKVYDFLIKKFWPYPEVIEIQGSKMYININDQSPSMRLTFQSYTTERIHERATTELFKKIIKKGDRF